MNQKWFQCSARTRSLSVSQSIKKVQRHTANKIIKCADRSSRANQEVCECAFVFTPRVRSGAVKLSAQIYDFNALFVWRYTFASLVQFYVGGDSYRREEGSFHQFGLVYAFIAGKVDGPRSGVAPALFVAVDFSEIYNPNANSNECFIFRFLFAGEYR